MIWSCLDKGEVWLPREQGSQAPILLSVSPDF